MKKHVRTLIIIAIILVILFFVLNSKMGFFRKPAAQAGSNPMMSDPVQVEAMVVRPTLLENKLNVTGSLLADEYVDLRAETAGKVTKIHFREGDQIQKSTLMLTINDAELRARLEKLKLQKKLYEDNVYRQKILFEKEAISKEEYDVALTELNKAAADIREVEAQLDKTRVLAPFTGIVGLRKVSEGAYVNSNSVIASFFRINPIKIDFSIPGRYSHLVQENQRIRFTVENFDQPYEGRIYAIEPQIDPETRTLKIRAISRNDNNELLPGKFVNIELTLESMKDALMVPNISIIPELNTHKVFLYKGGKAQTANIAIGTRTAEMTQITQGLYPGDTVITSGILQIREGSPVNISSIN